MFKIINGLIKKYPQLKQAFAFAAVGVSGTVIDFLILNFLVIIFSVNVYVSTAVAFCIATVNNFLWNKYWTFNFGQNQNSSKTQFILYWIVSTVGFFLNLAIMYVLIEYLNLWYNWAKLATVFVVFLWSFSANKFWTFKKSDQLKKNDKKDNIV